MLAAQAAGCKGLGDLEDLDGMEYRAWADFSMTGPSEVRTQLLIAQLIQMVSGALGGKSISMEKLLPYYSDITGANTPAGKKRRRDRHVAAHQSMVDDILSKVKGNG